MRTLIIFDSGGQPVLSRENRGQNLSRVKGISIILMR